MADLHKQSWEVMDVRNRVNEISTKLITEVEGLKGLVKGAKEKAKAEVKR